MNTFPHLVHLYSFTPVETFTYRPTLEPWLRVSPCGIPLSLWQNLSAIGFLLEIRSTLLMVYLLMMLLLANMYQNCMSLHARMQEVFLLSELSNAVEGQLRHSPCSYTVLHLGLSYNCFNAQIKLKNCFFLKFLWINKFRVRVIKSFKNFIWHKTLSWVTTVWSHGCCSPQMSRMLFTLVFNALVFPIFF